MLGNHFNGEVYYSAKRIIFNNVIKCNKGEINMSGFSGADVCFKCNGDMMVYSDYKPHAYVSGECLDCGFAYYTVDEQLSLDEVNELRKEQELKPVKKLKEQSLVW